MTKREEMLKMLIEQGYNEISSIKRNEILENEPIQLSSHCEVQWAPTNTTSSNIGSLSRPVANEDVMCIHKTTPFNGFYFLFGQKVSEKHIRRRFLLSLVLSSEFIVYHVFTN